MTENTTPLSVSYLRSLRRTFFDRQPYMEEIDYSRYLEEEHLFIRKDFREELNAIAVSMQG